MGRTSWFSLGTKLLTLLVCLSSRCLGDDTSPSIGDCSFPTHKSSPSSMDILEKLAKKTYATKTDVYSYEVGICTVPNPESWPQKETFKTAGAVQVSSDGNKFTSLGNLKKAELMSGSNWVILEYTDGEPYRSHCGNQSRRTIIMLTCKPGESEGIFRLVEEQRNKTGACYYLFELEHLAVCPVKSNGLSVGSILVIVFFLVASLYVIAGFIYQRFIAGAKGMEQIPNYSFWKDFGNLTADGCDFVCRSGGRNAQQKQYRGIGDDQLASNEEEVEDLRDEHLLPM